MYRRHADGITAAFFDSPQKQKDTCKLWVWRLSKNQLTSYVIPLEGSPDLVI